MFAGMLHRIILKDGEAGYAQAVPRQARAAILARYHYSLADGGGHAGGQTMFEQIRVHDTVDRRSGAPAA